MRNPNWRLGILGLAGALASGPTVAGDSPPPGRTNKLSPPAQELRLFAAEEKPVAAGLPLYDGGPALLKAVMPKELPASDETVTRVNRLHVSEAEDRCLQEPGPLKPADLTNPFEEHGLQGVSAVGPQLK